MRHASEPSKDHPGNGRMEFALIVAAIVLATVATYLALSKKLATVVVDIATMLGWI